MSAKKKQVKEVIDEELIEDVIGSEEDLSEETPADEATSGDADVESIDDQLAAALQKADDNWDQFLRTKAEMENLRRRNQKDVENAHKYGLEKFINEFIPIKESMELGIAIEDATVDSLHEGMQLTLNMFTSAFDKLAVEEINPVDEKFDPEAHQAMTMQPSDEVEPNTVLQVLQKGYRLNGRLIRPAMVIVSKAAE